MEEKINYEDYLPTPLVNQKPEVVTTKKRKRTKAETNKETIELLKRRARLYAKSPEAWRCVSRYSEKRLREYCEEKEHEQQQNLHETVFGFAHQAVAWVADFLSKGDGYVRDQIEADMTIRQCLEQEGQNWVQFLSNRWKCAACINIDIVNGKRRQYIETPVVVIEETNGEDGEEQTNTHHEEGQQDVVRKNSSIPIEPTTTQTTDKTTESSVFMQEEEDDERRNEDENQ